MVLLALAAAAAGTAAGGGGGGCADCTGVVGRLYDMDQACGLRAGGLSAWARVMQRQRREGSDLPESKRTAVWRRAQQQTSQRNSKCTRMSCRQPPPPLQLGLHRRCLQMDALQCSNRNLLAVEPRGWAEEQWGRVESLCVRCSAPIRVLHRCGCRASDAGRVPSGQSFGPHLTKLASTVRGGRRVCERSMTPANGVETEIAACTCASKCRALMDEQSVAKLWTASLER